MYLPIEPQSSCALAWLAATRTVNTERGHQANNVIIDVVDPVAESPTDKEIRLLVDGVLRRNGCWPIKTVANTIFPAALNFQLVCPASGPYPYQCAEALS